MKYLQEDSDALASIAWNMTSDDVVETSAGHANSCFGSGGGCGGGRKSAITAAIATACAPPCVGCGERIRDAFVMRVHPDLSWHAACLKCAECGCSLDESCTCFVKDGKTYCKADYTRLFMTKCVKCGVAFSKNDFVMRAGATVYHINCFRCSACNRQLVPGDEFAQRDRGLLCKLDNESLERSAAAAAAAAGASCPSSSPPSSGAAPSSAAPSSAAVVAIATVAAGIDSITGGGSSVCNGTTQQQQQQQQLEPLNGNYVGAIDGGGRDGRSAAAATRPQAPSCKSARMCGGGGQAPSAGGGSHQLQQQHQPSHKEGKTTRIRTVLNEKQLHTLRTCYAANPRPDALMKEQLVEMTGLSPRVIRVWFQNKRCKDKKKSILIKQLQQQQQNGVGSANADKHLMSSLQGVGLSGQQLSHDGQPPCKRLHSADMAMYSRGGSGGGEWGLLDAWYHADRPAAAAAATGTGYHHHSMMGSLYGSDDSSTYAPDDDMYVPPGSPSGSQFSDGTASPQSND